MKLNQTTIGELYAALSPLEIKQLSAYLDEKPNDKVKKLHQWMVKLTKENKLKDCDTDFLIQKILGKNAIYSSYTTVANLLINHIKDYLILSKIREKNIYTEVLWGEILIERKLKRNLLLKITNHKSDLSKEDYPIMKRYFQQREIFYYEHISLTKRTYYSMIKKLENLISSFIEYKNFYLIELYIGLYTLSKQQNIKIIPPSNDLLELTEIHKSSNNDLMIIQSLLLSLTIEPSVDSYITLKEFFIDRFLLFSNQIYLQVVPLLINFGQKMVNQGNEEYDKENYLIFDFLRKNKLLYVDGIFSVVRLFNFIRLELRYGTIEKAEQLLEESLKVITPAQKDSFQYLIESRIIFAKKDYKISLRKISTINPSDSIYYFPQYKIMLIKNYIMLADIDRLMAERENFYKYLNNQKNIQEDEKRRHKLFIKYTEYLTNARYEYLTDYMKKRIENALLQTSPYFSEKQWVRERWEELKGNE